MMDSLVLFQDVSRWLFVDFVRCDPILFACTALGACLMAEAARWSPKNTALAC